MILLQYPFAWPLIFTADNIMREERWSRLRAQLAAEKRLESATAPWDQVIRLSAYGDPAGPCAQWWHLNVMVPAQRQLQGNLNQGPSGVSFMGP